MRVFTAMFYLLFFNLTVFAQTQRPPNTPSIDPEIPAVSHMVYGTQGYVQISRKFAAASSLRVTVSFDLNGEVRG